MKSFVIAFALLVSGIAQAEVKAPGTLVPTRCATEVTSNSGVSGVCFAYRVGYEDQWLVLYQNNQNGRTTQVPLQILSVNPGNSGITGTFKSVIVTVLIQGDIAFPIHGTGTPGNVQTLNGSRFGNLDFQASGFEIVFTTQSF